MIVVCADQLRRMFSLCDDGLLYWENPPKQHKSLKGREAGSLWTSHIGKGYWHIQISGRKFKRSHIVFCITHGRWPVHQIDHINGNSLDDRPCNLREATPTQNAWNHKKRAKRLTLPIGVRTTSAGRFSARIGVNKKQITIGTFDTANEASVAYQYARQVHFGEFA